LGGRTRKKHYSLEEENMKYLLRKEPERPERKEEGRSHERERGGFNFADVRKAFTGRGKI